MLSDRYPNESMGINDSGRMLILASVQTVTDGKSDKSELYAWWPKIQKEFDQVKKVTKTDKSVPIKWLKASK